jgi:hypothetical protein
MGKGLVLLGLILIIVGFLPVIILALGIASLLEIAAYFYMLGLYTIILGGYPFSEIMLGLIGLGAILFLVGLFK